MINSASFKLPASTGCVAHKSETHITLRTFTNSKPGLSRRSVVAASSNQEPPWRRVSGTDDPTLPSSGSSSSSQDDEDADMWKSKPAWCQPWSIISSGCAFILGVFTVSGHSVIWSIVAAVPILVWWYLFLVEVPAMYKEQVMEAKALQGQGLQGLQQQERRD